MKEADREYQRAYDHVMAKWASVSNQGSNNMKRGPMGYLSVVLDVVTDDIPK